MKLAAKTAAEASGGNDGEGKTLRVSHSPWKSLRDSHIPTTPTTARLVQYNPRKELSSAIPSTFLQAHPSIGKDSDTN
jgi:hypothetical protein